MKQIYCENPVIIRNSNLKYLLTTYKTYHTPNQEITISNSIAEYYKYSFPEWNFNPYRFGVTSENIDDFYIINKHTGETFPMFILVPCGKCELCRDKKSREWSFRAVCESATATSMPYFLTLTYNNEHLPKCGIFKEEIQLFLKRLRIKLDRLNISHNLRYVAVGEYGTKSKRPHYHMILWNFPHDSEHFPHITSVTRLIKDCWTAHNGNFNSDGSPVMESLGYVYVLPCKQGCISYVMKYMKKCYTPPKGKNSLFFLASRKNGGLGAGYARKFLEHYRSHPDDTKMTATDPFTGYTQTMTMPGYFRRIYFPTLSVVLPKQIRDAHTELCKLISKRISIAHVLDPLFKFHVEDNEKTILKKYWFLPTQICIKSMPSYVNYYRTMSTTRLQNEYIDNCLRANELCRYLYLEIYDESYLKQRLELMEKRQQKMSLLYDSLPPMNIQDIKYNLIYRRKLQENKEII